MSITEGPIVPSNIGNDASLSPRVNLPVLMFAPVFASIIEPSLSRDRGLGSPSLVALQDAPVLPIDLHLPERVGRQSAQDFRFFPELITLRTQGAMSCGL